MVGPVLERVILTQPGFGWWQPMIQVHISHTTNFMPDSFASLGFSCPALAWARRHLREHAVCWEWICKQTMTSDLPFSHTGSKLRFLQNVAIPSKFTSLPDEASSMLWNLWNWMKKFQILPNICSTIGKINLATLWHKVLPYKCCRWSNNYWVWWACNLMGKDVWL